jgi:UDP-N-acetyl-D-mannosaminuronic acid dehydrogenase
VSSSKDPARIAIIGGCGRVGLPLGVKCALAGFQTTLVDVNERAVATVRGGRFPFLEQGGDAELAAALAKGLTATTDRAACRGADAFIFVTGTPVDEYLNPKVSDVVKVLEEYRDFIQPGTLVIMRSTLCPGMTEYVRRLFEDWKKPVRLAYCPERVAQGFGLVEIDSLPQIVAAFDQESFDRSYALFRKLAPTVIRLEPLEAELVKLMANSWRYLEFAIANQFYMLAERNGVDFFRVWQAIRTDYPRAASYRAPGLTAGPCLFKDTMQLASWGRQDFDLGHAAMHVNEGLADFAVDAAERALGGSVRGRTVALLGLAFKADCDDTRTSLSFRIKKGLEFRGATVLAHDPYVAGAPSLDSVIAKAELVVIGTPHREYRALDFGKKPLVDVWGMKRRPPVTQLPGTRSPKP